MNKSFPSQALAALLLALLTVTAFYPGLGGSFLFDDFPNIVSNRAVQAKTLDMDSLRLAASAYEPGAYGRPLATVSFALDYHAANGYDAPRFKRSSLFVHVLNSLLVLALVTSLLRLGGVAKPALPAFAIAAAWAVHPLQVSSVLYIVQRMETLATLFVLAALWAYAKGRSNQIAGRSGAALIAAGGLLAGVGMLSKESAVLFPLYAIALELTLLRFDAENPSTARRWRLAYWLGSAAGALAFLVLILPMYLDPASYEFREFGLGERLLSQLRILPMYLGWILLPLPGQLVFYYDDYATSTSLLSPITTLLGGLLLSALLSAAVVLRKRLPFFSLGIFWFFAAHFLTSNVVPFELVFEHRNYFAVLGIAIAAFDLLRRIPLRDGPGIIVAGVGVVLVGFLALCAIRSATWGEPLLLASEMARLNPHSARASNDLGEQYMVLADDSPDSPFYSMAEQEFERGSRLPSASPLTEQALILLAATAGVTPKQEWWDRLDRKLRERTIGPQEKVAVFGLFKQRYQGIELDDQRLGQSMKILFERSVMPPLAYAQFGDYALNYLHDGSLATRLFVQAVDAGPTDADYAQQIVATLVAENHPVQAKAVLDRATELGLIKPEKSN